jgi:hypothetical protein
MTSGLSRRRLLTVAGLTLGTAWIELAGPAAPAAAAPPAGQLTLEPVVDQPVPLLSASGSAPAALPRQLAVRVHNPGVELPVGTQVKVAFDERLYAAMASPLLTLGGRRVPAAAGTTRDAATGQTVCTLTLGESVPASSAGTGELIALLGTANAHLYPGDLVVAPVTAAAEVRATGRTAHRSLKPARPSAFGAAAVPWGVEVSGGWERLTWGPDGRYWYYYPVIVSVTGTGPGRTVAAEFTVTVDPQVVTAISVASARLNDSPYATSKVSRGQRSTTGTLRRVQWRTKARLAAGDRLDVALRVTTRTPAGALETITHPVVSTGMGIATAARQTGLMSMSRTDSSWQ